MELANLSLPNLAEAIAHLSEQIDEMRIEQKQHNRAAEEVLMQWSQTNLHLVDCLAVQAEDLSCSNSTQQELAKHLLSLAYTNNQLETSTQELKHSLEELTQYLQETQSPQVVALAQNTEELKISSQNLMQFLTGEQSKRLKLLEDGLKSLLKIYDVQRVRPPNAEIQTQNELPEEAKNRKFDFTQGISTVAAYSLMSCGLVLLLWHSGGIGNVLTRIDERSNWTMIKLERIESVLGIN